MKKFLLSLLTVAATFGFASAADVTDVITAADLPATSNQYVDFSNINSKSAAQYSGSTAKSVDIQIKKGTVFIWTTASGGTIKSISIAYKQGSTARNIDIYAANTAFSGSVSGSATATLSSSSLTWTPASTDKYTYFALKNATSNAAYLSKIEVVWTPAPQGLGEIMVGEEIADNLTPTIYSGEKIKFTCDNATSISYTAENGNDYNKSDEVQGAEIEWEAPTVTTATEYMVSVTATDGSKTAEATLMVTVKPERATTSLTFTSESLDFGADKIGTEVDGLIPTVTPEGAVVKYSSDNSEIVSVDENTGKLTINKIGTAVITATVAGTETYSDATASYSVNVSYSRLAQLLSLSKDDKFTLKNGNMTVVYQNGDYLYIQDETAGMLVFKNSNKYTVGSKFTDLSGTYSPYNGLPEITSGILDGFTTDDPITVKPVVRSVDYVSADVLNQYIMVEDLTIELSGSDYIATDVNGNTITLFKRWSNVTIPTGGHLSVAGFTSYYIDPKNGNTTLQIFPTEITGYVSPVSIIEGENTLTGDIVLSGADRTVNFTYPGHIEVWYKWEPTATPESVRARVASVDDNGFTKHEGEDIVLSTSGTLSYYSVNNGVKSAVSTIGVSGSGTTSISEISAELNGAEVIYDLQGRRVNRAAKGIFIVNGKKELRK